MTLDLEADLKVLGAYGGDTLKEQAKTRIRKYHTDAELLKIQYAALQEIAAEMARDNVRLRLENEGMRNQVPSAVTLSDLWNLETAILNGVEKIFSQQSESAYQPDVKTAAPASYYDSSHSFIEDYIDIRPVESARDNWFEAECFYNSNSGSGERDCGWTTSGTENTVDDQAHEHAQKHIDESKETK